jgi:predicted DNA-binding protein
MHILNVKISDELHKRFKIACIHEGKDMSTIVREFIENFVEKVDKKIKK